jgi:hypothetical protein
MGMVGMAIIVKLTHFLPSYGLLADCMLCLLFVSGLSWGTPSHKRWFDVVYKRHNY